VNIDTEQTKRFLRSLDPGGDQFTFMTFDDDSARGAKEARGTKHGTLASCVEHLALLNTAGLEDQISGAGVFVTVNETDGIARRKENVRRVRAVFLDMDGEDPTTVLELALERGVDPHIVVESSEGKFHVYWRVEDCSLDEFKSIQSALARTFGGDPAVCDLPRVMRLPGFLHTKDGKNPQIVKLLDADEGEREAFKCEELLERLNVKLETVWSKATTDGSRFQLPAEIKERNRNNTLFGFACSLRSKGGDHPSILEEVSKANRERCKKPLEEAEVENIVDNVVGRYEQGERFLESNSDVTVARRLIEDLGGEDVVCDEGLIRRFDASSGLWVTLPDDDLGKMIQDYDGRVSYRSGEDKFAKLRLGARKRDGILNCAKKEIQETGFFADAPNGIAFRNGFVRVTKEGLELEPLTRSHRVTVAAPFDFDQSAKAERWERYLQEIFEKDDPVDAEQKRALLQEFVGASVLGLAASYAKCLILLGEGSDGKSVFLNAIRNLLPKEAVSCCAPQTWKENYVPAMLRGVRLNLVAEMPERDFLETDRVKAIIAGDELMTRQIHEKPFVLRPIAGHIFSANSLPGTSDHSHGFWRRCMVVRFSRRFEFGQTGFQLKHELDSELAQEAPAIFVWALKGAVRLLNQGGYTEVASSAEAVKEWSQDADQVAVFVEEELVQLGGEFNPETWIQAKSLYTLHYRPWAVMSGHYPLSSTKFGKRIKKYVRSVKTNSRYYATKVR